MRLETARFLDSTGETTREFDELVVHDPFYANITGYNRIDEDTLAERILRQLTLNLYYAIVNKDYDAVREIKAQADHVHEHPGIYQVLNENPALLMSPPGYN